MRLHPGSGEKGSLDQQVMLVRGIGYYYIFHPAFLSQMGNQIYKCLVDLELES